MADCGNRRVVRVGPEVEVFGEGWPNPIDVVFAETAAGSCLLVSAGNGVHLLDPETKSFDVVAEGCLPAGLALEASGSLLFADAYDHCVVRCAWRSGGASRKVVAGGAGGRETRLQRPFAVALDLDGSLLVCDSGQHRILRFQRSGDTYAATGEVICGGEHGKGLHQLSYPRGLALEPGSGALLIADTFNHRLLRWRRGQRQGELLFGRRGQQLDQLNRPTAVAFCRKRQRLLVADSGNHRILSVPL